MREIKFRAWDRILKKMTYEVSMKLRECEYINILDMFTILNQRYDFMQYTGLKDANGKDIYEGDIVEAWSEGEKAIGKVKQRIDGLWLMYPAWQSGKIWGLMPNKERKTTVKIIGNIYENKELLRGEA